MGNCCDTIRAKLGVQVVTNTIRTLVVILIVSIVLSGCVRNPFESQVRALLNETGVPYKLNGCHGGWVRREMYCDVDISPDKINDFAAKLGLQAALPYFEGEKRFIIVSEKQNPADSILRDKYKKSFGIQQWVPTKHGFASAILFYNQKTGKGCLYLSIAYG
jgi:hypothetical protein